MRLNVNVKRVAESDYKDYKAKGSEPVRALQSSRSFYVEGANKRYCINA